jgi:hypothetical protein
MLKGAIGRAVQLLTPALALFTLFALACFAKAASALRRVRGLPRVVWGPTPCSSIKYLSQAVRKYGCESKTPVHWVYQLNS